jgi:hypothetical protein
MQYFPNGTQYSFSTTLGAAIPVTAITNADPAVATASAPPVDGSIVVIKSGWSALNDTVARTSGAAATTFDLEGVDTPSVSRYPAGEGAGSVQVATDFVGLSQVQTIAMSGGDQQFYQYQYVEDKNGRQHQKPTFKNAMTLTFTLDYDPALPWYADLITADQAGALVALKAVLPSGDTLLYLGYPSFNKVPTSTKNENQQVTATFSLAADPIRYSA